MNTKISREQVAAVHKEVRSAIEAVVARHGMALRKSRAAYSDYDIRFAVEVAVDNPEAAAETARAKFGWMFKDYGIDYGTELTDARGTRYTAVGFNRAGKLQAVSLKDGKTYHAPPRFFRLSGKPLESETDRLIAERGGGAEGLEVR